MNIECFHSRGQHLCKFIGTKESVCIKKEFNSHRIGLGHQHGGCCKGVNTFPLLGLKQFPLVRVVTGVRNSIAMG